MRRDRILSAAAVLTALALVALLAYSLDRTAWAFALFETGQPNGPALGLIAAVVVEFAAIALIAADAALSFLPRDARAWAWRTLVLILSVQWCVNLVAGAVRGGWLALDLFGTAGENWAGYVVGAVLWLIVNSAIPGIIFGLSKLESAIIAAWAVQHQPKPRGLKRAPAQLVQRAHTTRHTLVQQATYYREQVRVLEQRPALPDTEVGGVEVELSGQVVRRSWRQLSEATGVPVATLRRKVAGE